jgi:hypothetical protein
MPSPALPPPNCAPPSNGSFNAARTHNSRQFQERADYLF